MCIDGFFCVCSHIRGILNAWHTPMPTCPTSFQGHPAQLYRTLHLQHPTLHLYRHHHHQGQCLSLYLNRATHTLVHPWGTLQLSRSLARPAS